jgi:hypothetical protein
MHVAAMGLLIYRHRYDINCSSANCSLSISQNGRKYNFWSPSIAIYPSHEEFYNQLKWRSADDMQELRDCGITLVSMGNLIITVLSQYAKRYKRKECSSSCRRT